MPYFPALGALILLVREKLAVFERFPLKLISVEEWDFHYLHFFKCIFFTVLEVNFPKKSY